MTAGVKWDRGVGLRGKVWYWRFSVVVNGKRRWVQGRAEGEEDARLAMAAARRAVEGPLPIRALGQPAGPGRSYPRTPGPLSCDRQRRGHLCLHVDDLAASEVAAVRAYRVCGLWIREALEAGTCQCCGRQLTGRWCVDHDHRSGVARGLVCSRCNQGLAYVEDVPFTIQAVRYLGGHVPWWITPSRRPEAEARLVASGPPAGLRRGVV